uniref:Uncharacterized protein n=1 Tax=Anguilla anguilla TaxID=7936 RepID=A0A0E9SB31_ANGAN
MSIPLNSIQNDTQLGIMKEYIEYSQFQNNQKFFMLFTLDRIEI